MTFVLLIHSTVLAGCKVGDNAVVGTWAIVTKDVEAGHIVVGIPAKMAKVKDLCASGALVPQGDPAA
jgi:acetyltransferase-like isoleucine patch superfamily enzyme